MAAACLLVMGVRAQDITVGPKVGFNVSNVSDSDLNSKFSFHIGGFAEFKMSDFWAIQPELLYSRQGAADKINGTKVKLRLNYLSIPVLAKLRVWDHLSVDLGPELAFALNGKRKAKDGGTTVKTSVDKNAFALNLALGVSYNWDDLMFSARYNLGLSNALDEDVYGDNKNHVFQMSVGYRFGGLF